MKQTVFNIDGNIIDIVMGLSDVNPECKVNPALCSVEISDKHVLMAA